MSEFSDKVLIARTYVLMGALSGMPRPPSMKPTPEQLEARRKLWDEGPAVLEWCKAEAARMCDEEYGPNLTGKREDLLHVWP